MFVTVTTGNYSGAVIALRPNQEDHTIAKPGQTLQALLTVMFALIFHRNHRGIEDTSDLSQINAVILEVLFPLAFVPDNHALIVVTPNHPRQAFRNYSGPTLRSTPFASLSGRCAMKPRSAGHLERWAAFHGGAN